MGVGANPVLRAQAAPGVTPRHAGVRGRARGAREGEDEERVNPAGDGGFALRAPFARSSSGGRGAERSRAPAAPLWLSPRGCRGFSSLVLPVLVWGCHRAAGGAGGTGCGPGGSGCGSAAWLSAARSAVGHHVPPALAGQRVPPVLSLALSEKSGESLISKVSI